MELEAVRSELANMIREKCDLEAKVQELIRCHGELNALRDEVSKLKVSFVLSTLPRFKTLTFLLLSPIESSKLLDLDIVIH